MPLSDIYVNRKAREWSCACDATSPSPYDFHRSLPSYAATPLVSLDELAQQLGVKKILVKDESRRLGLPSFKILGASWGAFRAIAAKFDLPLNSNVAEVADVAQKHGIQLISATDGNHGRAVARMARLLKVTAQIFVPTFMSLHTRELIASEGANVTIVQGDYDAAVFEAAEKAKSSPEALLIQDTSFDGYEEIPRWIVDGYSTMFREIKDELEEQNLVPAAIITPVGVGSLALAVVNFCKSEGRHISVVTVEADSAACLLESLKNGSPTTVTTSTTIMDGMNCGTVSPISWPSLQRGVDAGVAVSDAESHAAVQYLASKGVNAGPCGAASLAALRRILDTPNSIELSPESVVVLLCTEGTRHYPAPDLEAS